MQRSVKHFTPRRRGERGGTGAAVEEVQEPGRSRGYRGYTKGHAAAAATRERHRERDREIYLLLPDAIKHFINESFQLLARDFTLTCPSIQGTVPYILYYMFLAAF